ncbi:NF-kappa-B inhibitor-interacting Ras-like protein 2 [Chamberlinius hualienensis]
MGKTSKVIVFGQKESGKTAIIEQLIYSHFINENEVTPTIEDIYVVNIESDRGIKEKLRFYDTTGLDPKSRDVPKHYLSFADGIVLVYSITNQDSFTTLDYIKKDIDKNREKKELPIIVLGNKKDLEDEVRQVDYDISQSWANREKVKLFEVSAKDRNNLIEPFVYLASKMNPPPSKSTLSQLARRKQGNSEGT